jgi:hypothetical protein
MKGPGWVALAVIVGLMATGVIPFEGAWKWAVFALILTLPFHREKNEHWVFWK